MIFNDWADKTEVILFEIIEAVFATSAKAKTL